ncbi:formate/nitrite transporter family protein [Joostella atrarenae]|uniref:Formate/nitrite transporter family protein n=1 Tax=Joostella atrarenae TaxID=679257 RepID=A0ABS9J1V9_9FLAO|nr:formate/nitrite transporter family protein [Joostella atrarenae]MCF8714412.1 formate/nitrite transporter family protein [Joostella atrarenae]
MSEEEKKKQEDIDNELHNSKKSDDNSAKSHGEILVEQICEGQEIYKRSTSSILLSSLAAGLEIGFSFLMICSVFYFFDGKVAEDSLFKIIALVYPIGFILVVLGQSILFTEQTSLLTLPVLNKKHSVGSLMRLWGLVIIGNLVGGWIIALFLSWIGPELGIFDTATINKIGEHVTDFSGLVIVSSAVLAGWLMGLLSWLITSSKDTVSRIIIIYVITSMMAFTGLHHSIIGNIEVFSGLLSSPNIHFYDYFKFQSLALLGNALGGAFFVALLKYRAFVYNV